MFFYLTLDFGLSRDIYQENYYRVHSKSLLPIRWMPAEAIIYGKFSTESDIWSFGVVLWELFTYGMQPYYGKNNQEVIEMIRSRNLLECPEKCPLNIYNMMLECWHEQPSKRISFSELHTRLRNLKAVYSNGCMTQIENKSIASSSTCNNNLNDSAYEVFDEPEMDNGSSNNNLMKIRLKNAEHDYQTVVNSNSCGNLLNQPNLSTDPSIERYDEHYENCNSSCINKLSIFKQSKTVDKSKFTSICK